MDKNEGTPLLNQDVLEGSEQNSLGQSGIEAGLPQIHWDIGTAYDFFISLTVLHNPEDFGLRASWAAGVRSRLSTVDKKTLLDAERACGSPITWIYQLPAPKNASSAIWTLGQIPAEERLPALAFDEGQSSRKKEIFLDVAERGAWDEADMEALKSVYKEDKTSKHKPTSPKILKNKLDTWAEVKDFGERYLAALESYYRVFFAEEETRIEPILRQELSRAQEMSNQLELMELLEQLSQGLHFDKILDKDKIILTPSFWASPLVFFDDIGESEMLLTFGARPAQDSLVPGEAIPDALLRGLKAISDPTRLRILRFLTCDPMTPADLARKLRLRAPTVTHHLKTLRLAGLVHLSIELNSEGHYAARLEAVEELNKNLDKFLKCE